ncbi:hypothetical protein J2S10_004480 [Neobacillus ginsengisoli]|uniref:Uncharacterized protein n=1 Tax=Neobacillus ginsengisoli TaxID=904295 RepID=A0ABT9Y0B9_9BACI|nr:hypothetical protein [Neobacillus ginsengisoli]
MERHVCEPIRDMETVKEMMEQALQSFFITF